MKDFIRVFLNLQYLSIICTNALVGEHVKQVNNDYDFPYIAALSHAKGTSPTNLLCGGALISPRHVLTANHCLGLHVDSKDVEVRIGKHDLINDRKYEITSWNTYEDWAKKKGEIVDENLDHALAIAELDEDVEDGKPVAISKFNDEELYGKRVVTAGWGRTIKTFSPVRFLHKAWVQVIPKEIGEDRLDNELHTANIPATVFGRGDGGAPLVHNRELVGVNHNILLDDALNPPERNAHLSAHYYREFIMHYANSGPHAAESSNSSKKRRIESSKI